MSRFYGTLQGSRGEASRQGTAGSGISGHIRGWDIGGAVSCWVGEDGLDRVTLRLTTGSNGHGQTKTIGTFRLTKTGRIVRDRKA